MNDRGRLSLSSAGLPIAFALSLHLLVLVRTAWVHEDAFITLRTVRNLLDGFGPVWNVGERVQSYTHPLWMLALSAFIGVTGEYYYTVIALCLLISTAVAAIIAFRHADGLLGAILALLLLTLSKAYTDFATAGLENPLTHLLLVCFLLLYLRPAYTRTTLLLAAGVAALGVTTRMDVAVIYLPMLLYMWWRVGWRAGFGPMALGALPFVIWELFALFYYGFPFPNTAYAKLNTAIPAVEYLQNGALFFIHTTGVDPLTSGAILVAVCLALLNANWQMRWLAVGILLYLAYLLTIGGDYMVGRFLTAPFVCAVIYLAHAAAEVRNRTALLATMALVVVVGLMTPLQSPLFADETYDLRRQNSAGLADERSWYNPALGLLTTDRHNRAYEMGHIQGGLKPGNVVAKGVGRAGFQASTHAYVIDLVGLGDPLLARLPARYLPNWRVGHPLRALPSGYEATLHTGENRLLDPDLAAYYDKLALIVRGELWGWPRLREIVRFNLGAYDDLIDVDRYRYPDRVTRRDDEVARTVAAGVTSPPPLPINQDGALIELGALSHDPTLLVGLNLDRFTLRYFDGEGEELGQQRVRAQALWMGDLIYHAVTVPEEIAASGYASIHLRPDTAAEFELTHFDMIPAGGRGPVHPEQLAELYAYHFYRAPRAQRTAQLDTLLAQMASADPVQWRAVPMAKLLDLLRIPDPALNVMVMDNLPRAVELSDAEDRPVLRYLGHTARPTPSDADKSGLTFRIDFAALDRLTEGYALWFHIADTESGQEWMIYDYALDPPVTEWAPGGLYTFEEVIKLDPGRYSITFGVWTPDRRRLYVDRGDDIYWIDLGEHEMPAP